MFTEPAPSDLPILGLTTIAANDSEITIITPKSADDLRMSIFKHAPRGPFYVCYYHPMVKKWYRIYNTDTRDYHAFNSAFIGLTETEALWSKVTAMNNMRDRTRKIATAHGMSPYNPYEKPGQIVTNVIPFQP